MILRFSIRIRYVCSSSLPVKSSDQDIEIAIPQVFVLLSGDKDRYKVYGKDGRLLCDAVFDSDGIKEGYGQKKYLDKQHPDWDIVKEGTWKEGVFQSGILRYEYERNLYSNTFVVQFA